MNVEIRGVKLFIKFTTYRDNGRLAVELVMEDGSPYAMLSCNIPAADIGPDEFAVKSWSENEVIAEACKHLFTPTGRAVPAGYATAAIWRRKTKKIVVFKITQQDRDLFVRNAVAIFDTKDEAIAWIANAPATAVTAFTWETVDYKP